MQYILSCFLFSFPRSVPPSQSPGLMPSFFLTVENKQANNKNKYKIIKTKTVQEVYAYVYTRMHTHKLKLKIGYHNISAKGW